MPSSARKSSIGTARRAVQKGHVPYRGDNPEVGKKTGIAVRHVDRKSDGFEPFADILSQADAKTPPKLKARKKKTPIAVILEDEDDGEMSMELTDSNANTPQVYFKNALQQPLSLSRATEPSRTIRRSSVIDYDQVPSPRPASQRFSVANGSTAGPSRLSHASVANDTPLEPDDDGIDDFGGGDDYAPQEDESPPGRRTSFTDMNQEDDNDDDEEEQDIDLEAIDHPRGRSMDKGKARALEESDNEQVEEDIAQDLDTLGNNDEEGDEEARPPSKKPYAEEKAKARPAKPRAKRRKRQDASRSPTPEGVRRSKRHRYGPLEWWRQERVVYGRRDSNNVVLVPHIKEIVRIPKEPPMPLGKYKRKRSAVRDRSQSKVDDLHEAIVLNPEEGWDDDTEPQCIVNEYTTNQEVSRRIAWTSKMFQPVLAGNANWSFQKIFGDGNFIAGGQLIIPPKSRKPSKPTKDNTYIFYVIEGAVNLRIHHSNLILATGAMFMVPRGNTYFIENISDRDAKLVFTQARKMGEEADVVESRRLSEARARARTSSVGLPSSGPQPDRSAALKRAASTKI